MWLSDAIITATNGQGRGPAFTAHDVVIDSRKATKGSLFVALAGERVDGHDYLHAAAMAGAAGALVSRPMPGAKLPCILVPDTLLALTRLAQAARARAKARVVAVTGSVGKTGAKEAIALALAAGGSVHATSGNYNNHIGLPLTLANLPPDADFAVLELGMNHAGEIDALAKLAQPDMAVITTVEAVHLEFFASVEDIARAKGEIIPHLRPGGTVLLNRDNRFYALLHAIAERANVREAAFGSDETAEYRLLESQTTPEGMRGRVRLVESEHDFAVAATGRPWVMNALMALAVADVMSVNIEAALNRLRAFREPKGRGQTRALQLPNGTTITVIDDCYNASPVSVAASLAKLAEIRAAVAPSGRTVAALGDMLELGPRAPALHAELAETIHTHPIDCVHTAGTLMLHLHEALPLHVRGLHAPDAATLARALSATLRPNDVVLIKGSHGSHMKQVLHAFTEETLDAL